MALHYSRLDSDTTDFVIRKTSLDEIVREAVRKYAKLFIRKKIRLDYQPLNIEVLTDEKWLEFVIEQILSNAVKYTPKGTVSIYMENEDTLIYNRRYRDRDTGRRLTESLRAGLHRL